jgi:hypothetical protein
VSVYRLLPPTESADAFGPTIPVDVHAPGAREWVVLDPLDPALAVAASSQVVLAGFRLRHPVQVFPSTVKPVTVAEDNLVSRWHGTHDRAVKIAGAVLAIDLFVPDRVALSAVTFRPVAPPEIGEKRVVAIINEHEAALG